MVTLPLFQEQFREAVSGMLVLPVYREVFMRFFLAYEYRRQFPWLEECQPQREGQSGLAVALQTALATYLVSEQMPSSASAFAPTQSSLQQDEHPLDGGQASEFVEAVAITLGEKLSLERFAQRLARAAVSIESNAPAVLCEHIAGALDQYSSQSEVGLSPDPC